MDSVANRPTMPEIMPPVLPRIKNPEIWRICDSYKSF